MNIMKWCNEINMWCSDIEEEEQEMIDCDGDCKNCERSEDVT